MDKLNKKEAIVTGVLTIVKGVEIRERKIVAVATVKAADTLAKLLGSKVEMVRLRAATALLEQAVALRGHVNTELRLRQVEERLGLGGKR